MMSADRRILVLALGLLSGMGWGFSACNVPPLRHESFRVHPAEKAEKYAAGLADAKYSWNAADSGFIEVFFTYRNLLGGALEDAALFDHGFDQPLHEAIDILTARFYMGLFYCLMAVVNQEHDIRPLPEDTLSFARSDVKEFGELRKIMVSHPERYDGRSLLCFDQMVAVHEAELTFVKSLVSGGISLPRSR